MIIEKSRKAIAKKIEITITDFPKILKVAKEEIKKYSVIETSPKNLSRNTAEIFFSREVFLFFDISSTL